MRRATGSRRLTGGRRASNRRRASPEIQLPAEPQPAGPLYQQLYVRLREHVLSGGLREGARLPSGRTLAADLGVSRNTVEAAIGQLVAEGFADRRVGSGTFVSNSLGESAPFARAPKRGSRTSALQAKAAGVLSERGEIVRRLGLTEMAFDTPTAPCAADVHGFPLAAWMRIVARHARHATVEALLAEGSAGARALRERIAEHASLARGLRCTSDQIVVVSSTQQALDLAARVLLDPGDTAIVEDPGYPSAWAALQGAGARLAHVAVDESGLRVDRLDAAGPARLVYVTPSHQFPLGVVMSLRRRLALLQWAAGSGAWILEDDYDSEFRYAGRPLAALHALDPAERVVYVASFNKVLFPGVRLAYLVVPSALSSAFAAAKRVADGGAPAFTQRVLAEFMQSGHFAAHLRQARRHYAACRDAVVEIIGRHWGRDVRLGPASTGLHLVVHLPAGTDDTALASRAGATDVGLAALSRYYGRAPGTPGLVVSFGVAGLARIAEVVANLAPHVRRAARTASVGLGSVRKVAPLIRR